MGKHAIVLGATGLIGSALVQQLILEDDYEKIIIIHRRATGFVNPKIEEHIVDFDQVESYSKLVKGDVLFSSLGTTLSKAGSKDAQYKIDFTYQYEVAKAAAENNVNTYVLVSSAGANPKSSVFYSRIKGELEEGVKKLGFGKLLIFQPSILAGDRKEFRFGEKIGLAVMNLVKWIPGIKKYRPIKDEIVARAIINGDRRLSNGIHVFVLDEIFDLAEED